MKFHLDGDTEFPTLCGTGTEDYFGGAWNFDLDGAYHTYSTPFLGFVQALPPGEINRPHQQFGMYRWHLRDPICFERGLRVSCRRWAAGQRPLPATGNADVATLALWYQHRSVTAGLH